MDPDDSDPKPPNHEAFLANDRPHPPNPSDVDRLVFARYELLRSGPLPTPETLQDYEDIVPGAAHTIIEMSYDQLRHRINSETTMIASKSDREAAGQKYAFWLSMVVSTGGLLLAHQGKLGGYILLIALLAALVSVFVTGKKVSIRELLAKRQEVDASLKAG